MTLMKALKFGNNRCMSGERGEREMGCYTHHDEDVKESHKLKRRKLTSTRVYIPVDHLQSYTNSTHSPIRVSFKSDMIRHADSPVGRQYGILVSTALPCRSQTDGQKKKTQDSSVRRGPGYFTMPSACKIKGV